MATLRVMPLPDGTQLRGNWQVKKSGKRESKHRKKRAAIRKMNRLASPGDTKVIHNKDGRAAKTFKHRK